MRKDWEDRKINTEVLFSSKSDEWYTPPDFYKKLNDEFEFTLDPCSTDDNTKCKKHFTMKENGLLQSWGKEIVFCNPPYSNVSEWVEKSYSESVNGATVVMLIPARTDTRWFHKYIYPFWSNQIKNNTYSYAAGIIDGEGCVSIQKHAPTPNNSNKTVSYSLRVSVKMTSLDTVTYLRNLFNEGHITTEAREAPYKNCYKWEACGKPAADVLTKIYPFSITKREQIFNAIEYYTQEIKNGEIGEFYYQKLRELKLQTSESSPKIDIRFIKGRLKFGDSKNSAPFPSMLVIFRPQN